MTIVPRIELVITVFMMALCASVAVGQSPEKNGKFTKEFDGPTTAHGNGYTELGKRKRIRGRFQSLAFDDLPMPEGTIISVYSVTGEKETFLFSYLVGANGRFYFKNLKPGVYLLKTGTIDGGFNSEDLKVELAPKDRDAKGDDIIVALAIGT